LLSGSYLLSSSSFDSRIDVIESNYATTGSNTFIGNQEIQGNVYVSNISNPFGFSTTSSLYTDGGLRVTKDAYISGSTFIAGNLTVYGTSSIEYVTSSTLIGLEFINLNTDTPSLRYAGINVFDSGSVGGSGSLLYDSQNNQWIFGHEESGSGDIDSSILLFGPLATNNFGSEPNLLPNRILKAESSNNHGHHVTQSAISDNGSLVSIDYRVNVTGSVTATSFTGSLDGSNIVNSSISNAKLANSTISGKALGTNLDTLTIGTGLSGTSYNGSAAVTIANTGVTAFNTRTGGVSLQASDISGLAAGIVSGSSQVVGSSITTNTVTFNGTAVALGSSGTITAANPNALTIGTGLSGTSYTGTSAVTIANTGVLSVTTNTGLSTNSSATGNVTITNTGVTSAVAGTAISVSGATGAVTINNTGVTSNVAGTGVSVSGATGAVTISIGQAVATSSNVQFNSLGVGTAGSGVTGEIRATADVTAFYSSDERLKEDIIPIDNPIEKLMAINGVTFNWKEGFETLHSHTGSDTGVIAQQIEAIELPGVVTTRDTGYKAVNYEKLNALLIEGFKVQQTLIYSQQSQIDELKTLVNQLLNK
jgi:hypothetical protein